MREAILAKAGGNPFFVEEIVRSLIVDFGGLVRSEADGRYRVTTKASRISIPDTLQGVNHGPRRPSG